MNKGKRKNAADSGQIIGLTIVIFFILPIGLPNLLVQAQLDVSSYCGTATIVFATHALPDDGADPIVYGNNVIFSFASTKAYLEVSHNGSSGPFRNVMLENGIGRSSDVRVVWSGTILYSVWIQTISRTQYVTESSSSNNGTSFGLPKTVALGTGEEVAANGPNLYIGYIGTDGVAQIAASRDNGSTFTTYTGSPRGTSAIEINIGEFGSNVYMTWENITGTTHRIGFLSSSNNGTTFNAKLLSGAQTSAREPIISVSNNSNVYVVWRGLSGPADIFFVSSKNNGSTFTAPLDISANSGDSRELWISSDGPRVHIIWRDNTGSSYYNVFVGSSADNGSTFSIVLVGGNTNITQVNKGRWSPEVVSLGNSVGVIYYTIFGNHQQILVGISTDGGKTFTVRTLDSGETLATNQLAYLAPDSGSFYFSWETSSQAKIVEYFPC